jgi:hypothetical protein
MRLPVKTRVSGSIPTGMLKYVLLLDTGMDYDVDIETPPDIQMMVFSPTYFLPISEYHMSMSDVGYRRH